MNVNNRPKRLKTAPSQSPKNAELFSKICDAGTRAEKLAGKIYKDLHTLPLEDTRRSYRELKVARTKYTDLAALQSDIELDKFAYNFFYRAIQSYLSLYITDDRIAKKLKRKLFRVIKKDIFAGKKVVLDIKIQNQFLRFIIQDKEDSKQLVKKIEEALRKNFSAFSRQVKTQPGPHCFPPEFRLPAEVTYQRVLSLKQIHELLQQGNIKQVEDYLSSFPCTSWTIEEELFSGKWNFDKELLADWFLKCDESCSKLARVLLSRCSLKRKEVAEVALKFALTTGYGFDLAIVYDQWPDLLPRENSEQDVLHLMSCGRFWHAQQIIERGNLSPNMASVMFDPRLGTLKDTTLKVFWKFITLSWPYYEDKVLRLSPDQFLKFLISKNVDLNVQTKFDVKDVVYDSIVEALLAFIETEKDPMMLKVMNVLLESNALVNLPSITFLFNRSEDPFFKPFLEILVRKGTISAEDETLFISKKNTPKTPLQEDLNLAMQYTQYLQSQIHMSRLYQNRLDLNMVKSAKEVKKRLKNQLKGNKKIISKIYRELALVYDQVVQNHLELNQLKNLSLEFRTQARLRIEKREFSKKLIRFVGLATGTPEKLECQHKINQLIADGPTTSWKGLYDKIISSAEIVKKDEYLSTHMITWLHATKSKSLPCILQSGNLLSMGHILNGNGVTFTGELCGSEDVVNNGINRTSISGERFSQNWEDGDPMYHNVASRYLMSYYYAVKEKATLQNEMYFDPIIAMARLSEENIKLTLDNKKVTNWHGLFVSFHFDILRLRSTVPSIALEEKLKNLKIFLEQLLVERYDPRDIKEIKFLLSAIEVKIGLSFNPEELAMILDPKPYGIIFASTTEYSKAFIHNDIIWEYLLKSPVDLGQQIQVAFTSPEKVNELREKLKAFRIHHVYGFDIGFYLEWKNMIMGEQEQLLRVSRLDPIIQSQLFLAHTLQNEILPQYVRPFPAAPTYLSETAKIEIPLPKPFFCKRV